MKYIIPFMLLHLFIFALHSVGEESSSTVEKIGVIAPLSGPAAELGTQIRNGIELAKEDFAPKLEFVYEDDMCDAKSAVSAAMKLSNLDKVSVVIGPLCSPPFLAVSQILNRGKIVFIHTSSGTQNTASKKGEFGIEGTATVMEEHKYLAKYVRSQGAKRAAIIHWEQEWASGHALAFKEAFEAGGGVIVSNESFLNVDEADFKPYIIRIKSSNPDSVFIGALNGQTATILKQLRQLGVSVPVYGQYDVEDPVFLEAAGSVAEGVRYTYPFNNERLSEKAKEFEKKYLVTYKKLPSFYPYNGYDLARLVDKAVHECGTDTTCIYKSIIATKNYEGLTGTLSFSSDGNIHRDFIMKEIKNGKFSVIEEKS